MMTKLMGKIDVFAQRVVDEVMFFLMRKTGWKKSFLIYAADALALLVWGVSCLVAWRELTTTGAKVAVVVIFGVFWSSTIVLSEVNRRHEEWRENHGVVRARLNPFRWYWWIDVLIEPLRSLLFNNMWVYTACWEGFALLTLFAMYAACTPPRPPPEKEPQRAMRLVPVRSVS